MATMAIDFVRHMFLPIFQKIACPTGRAGD
jgi:hypothetical protein